jgi:pyochelin biosynthetic protein PchC
MVARDDSTLWFRRFSAAGETSLRLMCFPHAGGAANFFRSWPETLPADVELLAVQYPGRHDRMRDPCLRTMPEMADSIARAMAALEARPTVFFGHSMGAAIAFEVALRLEQAEAAAPSEIVVSSREPSGLAHRRRKNSWSDEEIITEIKRLGGTAGEFIGDPDFRDFSMPALRGDFALIGSYLPSPRSTTRAAITAYVGSHDPDLSEADMRGWSAHTESTFESQLFPGDHFYLVDGRDDVLRHLAKRLDKR